MADTPEHIWAYHAPELAEDNPGCTIVAGENRMEFSQEYIRADLVEALKAENQRLCEALAWYGEQARLARLIHREGDAGRRNLEADGGSRARAALCNTEASA